MAGRCACAAIHKVKATNCVSVADFGHLVSVPYLHRSLGDKPVEKNFSPPEKSHDKSVVAEASK